MKKFILILLVLLCLGFAPVIAETPQIFTFNVGSMFYHDFTTETNDVEFPFGVDFQLNKSFSAGFKFFTNTELVSITASPMDNLYASVYAGSVYNSLGFGVGLGYDVLVKKGAMFSALGVYVDWLANNSAGGGAFASVSDGGVLMVGLKTKFGI